MGRLCIDCATINVTTDDPVLYREELATSEQNWLVERRQSYGGSILYLEQTMEMISPSNGSMTHTIVNQIFIGDELASLIELRDALTASIDMRIARGQAERAALPPVDPSPAAGPRTY